MNTHPSMRPTFRGMQWQLLIGSCFVFLAGIPLFLAPDRTDLYFAWTISPPLLTAVFLGASYWGSFLVGFLASRQLVWANARIAVPGPLIFTLLTLAATLLHVDRFHFGSPNALASAFAWVWLAVYALVPASMIVMLLIQLRIPGGDPPRQQRLAPWMRVVLIIIAVILLSLGIALFIAPQTAASLWAWKLTPLTARAIAAWLIGYGVLSAQAAWENDRVRVRPMMIGYIATGVLQFIALARYPGDVTWSDPRLWVYLIFLAVMMAVGALGLTNTVSYSLAPDR